MRAQEFQESAADELKRKLPSLRHPNYTTIDKLMKRISTRYSITGKNLHDMFVGKYGVTPDHWIKKYKVELEETKKLSTSEKLNRNLKRAGFDADASLARINAIQAKYAKKPEEEPKKKTNESVESDAEVQQIKDFINWTIKKLNLQKPYPNITLSRDTEQAQQGHHTGVHTEDPENRCIWVYIENRNLIDIFRTIFHELVHERQSQLNMIQSGDSYPGSPIEAMADMLAGKYIKIYGKKHPEIFQ